MARVGFVGTGIMGMPMVLNLLKVGHHVQVWNRTVAKLEPLKNAGASICTELEFVGQDVDVLICMLSDGPTCNDVLFKDRGALAQLQAGSTVIMMSSIPVDTAKEQYQQCLARSLHYLDAPVSGGEKGAKNASLAIMAGGELSVFQSVNHILSAMGRPVLVGGAGCGTLAKLANQMIVASTIATVSEALLFTIQGGADPTKVKQALTGGFADSPILQQHGERMLTQNFAPGGTVQTQYKDTHTAVTYAKSLSLHLPVIELVDQLYANMIQAGDANLDHSALIREFQRMNNCEDELI